MPNQASRSTSSDVELWLKDHGISPADVDQDDMLTYVHEWEDAHPEMAESSRTSQAHRDKIEDAWRKALEASRLIAGVNPAT